MRGLGRMAVLPPALVSLLFVSLSRASTLNFDFYPKDSQECLVQSANASNCESGTAEEAYSCLCNNGGNFVTKAATCLGKEDPGDLEEVYKNMRASCADKKKPLTVLESQWWLDAGYEGTERPTQSPTSAVPSSTSASSATPTAPSEVSASASPSGAPEGKKEEDDDDDGDSQESNKGGLSSGARAGIIAGAVVAGVGLLAALLFFLFRYKRRRDEEESHPMLPQNTAHVAALVPTPAETSALDSVRWSSKGTAGGRDSGFNWETPYDLGWPANESPPLEGHLSGAGAGVTGDAPAYSAAVGGNQGLGTTTTSTATTIVSPPSAHSHTSPHELVGQVPSEVEGTSMETARTPFLPPEPSAPYSGVGWESLDPTITRPPSRPVR